MKLRHKGLFSLLGLALVAGVGSGIAVAGNAPEAAHAATITQTVYTCDFETAGGFIAGQSYQSTVNHTDTSTGAKSVNTDGIAWEIYYGNWSTSSKINGEQSAALRCYTDGNLAYLMTETDITGVTSVSYYAKASTSNSAKLLLDVSYSIDQGATWTKAVDAAELGNSNPSEASTANFSNVTSTDGVRVKFAIASSSTAPTTKNTQMTIDDIAFNVTTEVPFTTITASGTPSKTTQYTGNAFDYTGLTFTGDDGTVINGADITWNPLEAGKSPTGTYMGVTVTVTSVTVVENSVSSITIGGSMSKTVYKVGESWDPTGLTVTALMLSGDQVVVTDSAVWSYNPANATDTTIESVTVTATYAEQTDDFVAAVKVYESVNVTSVDEITRDKITTSASSYTTVTGVAPGASPAVYSVNLSATATNYIQIRTSGGESGIVSTTSGGKVKSIALEWDSSTATERVVDVYGSNTAYTAPSDLFSSEAATQGTKLGSINCGVTTALEVTGDYAYVGIRSSSNALFLTKITITWDTLVFPEKFAVVKTNPSDVEYMSGQSLVGDGLVATVTYSDGSTKDVAYTGNESRFSFSPSTLSAGTTQVTATYKEYTEAGVQFTITGLTVSAATLTDISVTTMPTTSTYSAGEPIDYTGLVVTATYSAGDPVDVGPDDLDLSPAAGTVVTFDDAANGTITVTYNLKSTPSVQRTFDLTVNAAEAVFAKVTSVDELELGATYTFAYDDSANNAVRAIGTTKTNGRYEAIDALYSDGLMFFDSESVHDFTLAPGNASGKYALWSDAESGYINQDISTTGAGSSIYIESTFANGNLTISFNEDGTVLILDDDRYVGYNSGSFGFYTSSTQYPMCLYKRYTPSNTAYADADSWANSFVTATESHCTDGTIEANWDSILAENPVPTDVLAKDFLVRGTANADTGANLIDQALARYDYIVNKYATLDDPLGRRDSTASPAWHIDDLGDNSTLVVILSAFSFSILLGGAILLRRRFKGSR